MTARGTTAKKLVAMLLCVLMMFPAVFLLLKNISFAEGFSISDCDIAEIGEVLYSPGGAMPIPVITNGNTTLTHETDYTLSFRDNKAIGTGYVIIKGIGVYYGTTEKSFVIKQRDIADTEISVSDVFYNTDGKRPKVGVSVDGRYFTEGKDYTLSYTDNSDGTVTVKVSGIGGLTGSKEVLYSSIRVPLIQAEADCEDVTYTADAVTPPVTVTYNGVTLTEGTDYIVQYEDNINVGKATAVIKGRGRYVGAINERFYVLPADISMAEFSVSGQYLPGGTEYQIKAEYLGKELSSEDFSVTLPDKVGTHEITVTGIGNFSGEKVINAEISAADISQGEINISFSESYDSYSIAVYYGEYLLEEGNDYTLTSGQDGVYETVTVNGIGNYTGTLQKTFKVSGLTPLDLALVNEIPPHIYTGEYIRPEVILTYNGEELVYGTDYYLTYENNKNAGTTIITVTGMGDSYGTVREIPFRILPLDINNCKLICDNMTYTGEELTPVPLITFGNYTLLQDTDFIIDGYTDNVNAGKGTVTVSGTGNYTGSAELVFMIIEKTYMQDLIKERLDEMMDGSHDRQINSYVHSYKLGNYYNTLMTSACTCHSYCNTGYESGCTCLIGRSTVLNNSGIQCAGFAMEVFEYLFGGTNGAGENICTTYNRTDNEWTEDAIKEWMINSFRPGDYLAYDNVAYYYPHYLIVYSVEADGLWVYEANYGGRCKINFRKMTYTEIYNQLDDLYHRTPVNYELSE